MMIFAGCALGALFLSIFGFLAIREAERARRAIEETPRYGCGETEPGPAKVFGQARASEPLLSPVSRTPCVYSHLAIYKQSSTDREPELVTSARSWAHDWWIEDETGALRIDPDDARVISRTRDRGGLSYSQPEEIRQILHDYGVEEGLFGRTRVVEQYIAIDSPVFACGVVRGNPPVLGGREKLVISVGTEETAREFAGSSAMGFAMLAAAALLLLFGYGEYADQEADAQQSAGKLRTYRE